MISSPPTTRRRFLAGLVPLLLALGVLPLLAPTCGPGGEGIKTFSRHSLIIPMDVCYQSQADGSSRNHTYSPATTPNPCPGAQDPGSVVKAYGLVYQLIRSNIAVYWVIDQGKTSLTDYDMQVQYNGGWPVLKYNWSTRQPGDAPATATNPNIIRYRGGPFVVDGSDYDRALQVLRSYEGTFGPASGAQVNIHISNVAFQGYAKKTMAGGWSAGGTIPPKLALLDIGSGNISSVDSSGNATAISDPKNAQPVISGYLVEAGIGTGTAAGTATGTHGEIYDKLTIDDFQPQAGSTDVHTSNLFQNGYEILWVPHWVAPGSCSNYTSNGGKTAQQNCLASLYTTTKITQVLKTIGTYVAEGHDLFAECAGLGSFEGTFKRGHTGTADADYTIDYKKGWVGDATNPTTRFQSTVGVRYNEVDADTNTGGVQFPAPAFTAGNFGSPLLQLGDYGFTPVTGAVEDYRPQDATNYQPDTIRLVTGSGSFPNWDFFSLRPRVSSSNRGTIVYLAGHSYSGVQGSFQIAGSRLVLNTLFNLGAACTASGVACDTGKLGVCARGVIQCVSGQPQCVQTVFPSPEVCDGLDNDCNGLVDDMDTTCYDGPAGTNGVGLCHGGIRSCQQQPDGSYAMSACIGEVLPTSELCNGLDDNCNGSVDENLTQPCYTGPTSSLGANGQPQGICKAGLQTCTNGSWSACTVCTGTEVPGTPAYQACQILPKPENCSTPYDENCDGQVNESASCPSCTPGTSVTCYSGPAGTVNVGVCHAGTQTCDSNGFWGPCLGQVTPTPEVCSPAICATTQCTGNPSDPACAACNKDENCDGQVDENCGCKPGDKQSCYDGPPGTAGVGICKAGYQECDGGVFRGPCLAEILPAPETCDGQDNDCNGTIDNGATCAGGFYCEHGVCVKDNCDNAENLCPEGYTCSDTTHKCVLATCGAGATTCPDGAMCLDGQCKQACPAPGQESICWPGAYCQSGGCVGGSCYYTGCKDSNGNPTGQLCQQGTCKPDPCAGVACPAGTFCRQGDCVQSCAYVTCPTGQSCSVDGFCEPDACSGKTCGVGTICVDGNCVADPCAGKGCGAGQVCQDQVCVDDPCTGVACPAGRCLAGQCYAVGNPDPGTYNPPGGGSSSSGCGCGEGAASPLSALLFLLLVPLARRRRSGGRAALVLLASVALLASACGTKSSTPFEPGSCSGGWTSCEGETRCIDVWTDPANCGGCGAACAAGQKCVDKVCGPAGGVAPHITALSPAEGDQGRATPLTVTLNGERFQSGATLRSVSTFGSTTVDTVFVDSSHLQANLDLSASSPSTMYLRVVNPDKVISNVIAFDVVTPTPHIDGISPAAVVAGTQANVTVQGSGFLASSLCHLGGAGLAYDLVLATSPSGSDLTCAVDAATLVPSSGYQLWVVNQADPTPLESNRVALTVNTQTPVLTDLSPNQGQTGAIISLTLGGTGFDATSVALWDGSLPSGSAGTLFLDPQHLYVSQLLLSGAGTHTISVRNGNSSSNYVTSGTLSFTVGSAPPALTGLSPGSAYQGDTAITLTVSGSAIPAGATIQLQPPGGGWTSLGTSGSGLSVSATTDFVGAPFAAAGAVPPAGDWLARLLYSGGATSSTMPFRLLSNQAILQSADHRSVAQGDSVLVTMSVANLRGAGASSPYGVTVEFSGGTPVTMGTVSTKTGTGTVSATISALNLLTGTYTLKVKNPSALSSNPLSFSVTPGLPHLTQPLSPASAAQQETPVTVTITGSNFARPDASGGGGSAVHIFNATVTDFRIPSLLNCTAALAPCALVTDSQHMTAYVDTRMGPPAAYSVQVWNPGGPTPPQKSPETLTFTITP